MSLPRHTPLLRHTPLKRGGLLAPMSPQKLAIQPRYRAALRDARLAQVAARGHMFCVLPDCPRKGAECFPDPHHTQGRVRENLLIFILVCRTCHQWINDHQKLAREKGLIQ